MRIFSHVCSNSMTQQQLKYYFSSARFNIYLSVTGNDFEKARKLYITNIELSEAFYPALSLLEVCLRNAIHEKLQVHFDNLYWYKNCLPIEFLPYVSSATQKLAAQRKPITADRIIAALNFGFWSKLFNNHHSRLLWKPLRLILKQCQNI